MVKTVLQAFRVVSAEVGNGEMMRIDLCTAAISFFLDKTLDQIIAIALFVVVK
jgi:hypothetical protein